MRLCLFHRQIFICALFWAYLFAASIPTVQADEIQLIERPDNEFLILGLVVNGIERSEGTEAYLPDDAPPEEILLPLGFLGDNLSVGIETDPAAGIAGGFYLRTENAFQMDINNGFVEVGSKRFDIPPGAVEPQYDDIYVQLKFLEEILDLNFEFDPSSLSLSITSEEPLPFQATDMRRQRAERLLTKQKRNDFNPQDAYLLPYDMASRPTVTLQQTLNGNRNNNNNSYQAVGNIQAGFDFLKFGSDFNMTYGYDDDDGAEIRNARLTFSRSDPLQEMLGPLNAGRIDIGDVDFSEVPLLLGNRRGAGIYISSETDYGFRISQQLGSVLIDGDAPVGWDVELYRNAQFIDFQIVEGDARFSFEDVQLINGFNRFQIILFGPEGERKTITRDIFSGPNMLADGVLKYDFAAGMPDSTFLPLAEDRKDDTSFGIGGKVFYGVNDFLTVGGNVYTGPMEDTDGTSAALSLITAFKGFNFQAQQLAATDGKYASQLGVRKRLFDTNMAFTHTRFTGFESGLQNIKRNTEISLSRSFGGLNVTLIGEKQEYLDQEDRTILQSILSSKIFGLRFTNDLTKTFSENDSVDDLEGELSIFTDIKDTRIRSALIYDLDDEATDTFRNFRMSAQRRLKNQNTLRIGANYDFSSDLLSADARYTHQFDPVAVDFDIGGNSDQDIFVGITLRVGFQPGIDGYEFVSPRISSLAQLGVRGYVDENDNDIFDDNESIISDLTFQSTNSSATTTSDAEGVAYLKGLPQTPTRISVDQEKIPSIYLLPKRRNIDLIPRRGAERILDFPFTQLGEIDGFVMHAQTGDPLENIPVKLINTDTGEEIAGFNSELDGFFIFSAIPVANYKVIASQGWFDENEANTDFETVSLTAKDNIVLDVTLEITPDENYSQTEEEFPEEILENNAETIENKENISTSKGIMKAADNMAKELAKRLVCGKNCKK